MPAEDAPVTPFTGRRCSSAWRARRSTCSSSAAASPASGSPSTPPRRGLRTALVEADDFASGTSSKSSKLVHGGLRYLQQGDVRLVYEALHERQRLRRNAPHLVKLLPFMIPILTKDGVIPRRVARALGSAMWMYDVTGGFRIGRLHKRLKADAAFAHLPTMPPRAALRRLPVLRRHHRRRPAGADDRPHRRRPRRRGRQPLPGRRPHQGRRRPGRRGHRRGRRPALRRRRPRRRQRRRRVGRRGPHTGGRRRPRLDPPGEGRPPHRSVGQGAQRHRRRHPRAAATSAACSSCRGDRATTARSGTPTSAPPTPTTTARSTIPRARPTTSRYVLDALNAAVTTGVTPDDVTGVWAGLRPLVKSATSGRTADLSRRHRVTVGPAGVIGIAGGKLTTYREMAEDTVDAVLRRLGRQGALPHQAAAPRWAPTATARRRRARRPPTSPTASARWRWRSRPSSLPIPRSASRSSPASRTCAPRRSTPPATRWRRRSTTS